MLAKSRCIKKLVVPLFPIEPINISNQSRNHVVAGSIELSGTKPASYVSSEFHLCLD